MVNLLAAGNPWTVSLTNCKLNLASIDYGNNGRCLRQCKTCWNCLQRNRYKYTALNEATGACRLEFHLFRMVVSYEGARARWWLLLVWSYQHTVLQCCCLPFWSSQPLQGSWTDCSFRSPFLVAQTSEIIVATFSRRGVFTVKPDQLGHWPCTRSLPDLGSSLSWRGFH